MPTLKNGFADDPQSVAANVTRALDTGIAAMSIEDWSGSILYDMDLAAARIAAARAAIDPNIVLVGRSENFRVPGLSASASIARAVACAEAGAHCLFVPFILDHGVIAELVAAVAPKPVNVLIQTYDASVSAIAELGVRRCSVGGRLAQASWKAFDAAASTLKQCEP